VSGRSSDRLWFKDRTKDRLQSGGRLRSKDRHWSIGRGSRCLGSKVFLRLFLFGLLSPACAPTPVGHFSGFFSGS
ncbi:unnamed protein product, partial [Amoebophrya sp. A25]